MCCLHQISRSHTHTHTHTQSLTQITLHYIHYLSQQGAGNIIVSKGIKATASIVRVKIHTYTASLSLSLALSLSLSLLLSHKWTLDKLHWEYIEVEIAKLQASRCFQKARACIHCGESACTYGCQVNKDKYPHLADISILRKWEAFSGITSLYIRQPGQIKHWC